MGRKAQPLEVSFEPPSSGWIAIRLSTPEATFVKSFSHIYPSLEQLCAALDEVGAGLPARSVTLFLEPAELDLRIDPASNDEALLTLRLFEGRARSAAVDTVFTYVGPTRDLVARFWRALRRLQTSLPPERFAEEWHTAFPELEMNVLTKRVASWKK